MTRVLVTDDEVDRRKTHESFLAILGVDVESADSIPSADDLVTSTPLFELSILDINFDPKSLGNKEGLEYAKHLKKMGYPTYLVACSVYVKNVEGLEEDLNAIFDDTLPPNPDLLDYERVLKEARTHKAEKLKETYLATRDFLAVSSSELEEIKRTHSLQRDDLETLSSEYKAYVKEGYKLTLALPSFDGTVVGKSFILWSRNFDGGVFLEVYKFPEIYAYGDNEKEALKMLGDVIVGLYSDAASGSIEDLDIHSDQMNVVWSFVKDVFGG